MAGLAIEVVTAEDKPQGKKAEFMKHFNKITFPTYLTLIRLIGAPFLVPFFIVNYLPQNNIVTNVLIAALFLLFGFTDFLDGFFARRYAQESKFGAALDHLADKVLTFSACIALVAIGKMGYFWAILLIGRELLMMGLREIALEYDVRITVSSWGKIKTVLHIALIAWIIANPMQQQQTAYFFNGVEVILLCASVLVSWGSAVNYFIVFYAHLKK